MSEPVQSIRVLLVEDEAGDAYLVKKTLKETREIQFEVTWVESLKATKEAFNAASFDLLLLDLSLPDSEGLQTVEIARQICGEIPIVILTGRCDTDFALSALKAGANDYMIKGDCGCCFDGLIRVIRYTLLRAEMEAHNKLLVAALNAAANGIVITDSNAVIKWVNPAFSRLTGYELDEIIGSKPSELVKSNIQNKEFYQKMWDRLLAKRHWRGEIINKRKNGSLYHEELSISPVENARGEIINFIGVKQDITERKALENMLHKLANTDSLTGLFNRRAFLERLAIESERILRSNDCATLLMLDLDFFKRINDTYGHAIGDEALKEFANIMKKQSRGIDIPARLGGEEFVILLPSTNRNDATIMAERLRTQVSEIVIATPKGDVQFTVSIGAALLTKENANGEITLNHADTALYAAKESGRNKICWF